MSEQVQTEEQGGSVVMPLAVGAAATYATHRGYQGAANKLATDAIAGAEKVKPELTAAAQSALNADAKLAQNYTSAKVLQEEGRIAGLTGAKIEKLADINGKPQGFNVSVTHANGNASTLTVDKLSSEATKILGDKQSATLAAEELQVITAAGEKSWVAKMAPEAEKVALKAVRGAEGYKAAGGIKAVLSHAGAGKGALLAAGTAAAAVGLGVGVKNMFGGSKADAIQAERDAPKTTEATR